MRHIFIALVAALALGLAARVAEAWVTYGEWGSNEITMRASSVSFPSGNAYRTALGTVTSRIYNNPSECWITQLYDDTSIGFSNGQSEVWFSSDSQYNPAVTFPIVLFGLIIEADVVFYNGEAYTTSMNKTSLWPYGGASRPFETTCMHEYGHVLGISHESDEYNIMGQDWTHIHANGATCRSCLGEDASSAAVALYGLASGGSFQDLSVTLFKWLGRSGEYSTHQLCRMFTGSGGSLSSTAFNGQRRYNVSRSTSYQVEFTYENNGENTQSFNVGFYISTNSTISTSDTRFATRRIDSMGRGDVFTSRTTVTIPSNLTSGVTYYLGVIVDYDNALTEVDGSNNAAYHIIRIN